MTKGEGAALALWVRISFVNHATVLEETNDVVCQR
ncbi:hypothetical protein SCE1572_18775 [Sorangium cellulosum So0157-2]|uniref:Uncharacterized protein n=1 Tax=Sorangium cellulosum So0157-2 TaxID=1254432 RepID=S4XV18_SORCE|nr:hypothetical protein SCE1572_18775 [Sorangium cellulosum So0157-2]